MSKYHFQQYSPRCSCGCEVRDTPNRPYAARCTDVATIAFPWNDWKDRMLSVLSHASRTSSNLLWLRTNTKGTEGNRHIPVTTWVQHMTCTAPLRWTEQRTYRTDLSHNRQSFLISSSALLHCTTPVLSTRKFPGCPHSIGDISLAEHDAQITFLSNCNHTLLV